MNRAEEGQTACGGGGGGGGGDTHWKSSSSCLAPHPPLPPWENESRTHTKIKVNIQ